VIGGRADPERRRQVRREIVFHNCAIAGAAQVPRALLNSVNWQSASAPINRTYVANVLRKIAHLIKRIPYWQLQQAFVRALRKPKSHMEQAFASMS
jgi:hypothetical protein